MCTSVRCSLKWLFLALPIRYLWKVSGIISLKNFFWPVFAWKKEMVVHSKNREAWCKYCKHSSRQRVIKSFTLTLLTNVKLRWSNAQPGGRNLCQIPHYIYYYTKLTSSQMPGSQGDERSRNQLIYYCDRGMSLAMGPIVQRWDKVIHWINHYPWDKCYKMNKAICWIGIYPEDSVIYHMFFWTTEGRCSSIWDKIVLIYKGVET